MIKDTNYSFKEYKEKIIPIIKEKKGIVMPADIALKTNYPLIHIKYTLNILAADYQADIIPTEDGNLLYKFDPNLTNLSKSMGKFFKKLGKWSLGAMKTIFKVVIMLMLVGYMVLYLAVLIGLMFKDDDGDINLDVVFGLIRVIFEMLYYSFLFRDPYRSLGRHKKRPFYIRVFSFVFGDDQKPEEINHEGNVLRFLKMHKQITFSEALNITGESEEFIKKLLVDITVKYEGDIEVNDDGVIVYRFENLNFTDDNKEQISYAWSRTVPIPKQNYNKKGENAVIIAINLFNLVMATVATVMFSGNGIVVEGALVTTPIWITIIPLVYSILFFAIPIFRSFSLKKKIPKINTYNDFTKELLRVKRLKKDNAVGFSSLQSGLSVGGLSESYIDINSMNKDTAKYFYENYQDIFTYDFKENQEILDATNYHNELIN